MRAAMTIVTLVILLPLLAAGGTVPAVGAADPGGSVAKPPVETSESPQAFLEGLFKRLKATSDAVEAEGIAGLIERIWSRSGSDTADLLMSRATAAMQAKENDLALTLLGRLVEIQPDWAEAWNTRATLLYEMDDLDASALDIQQVLTLEPRHFGALSGLGIILEREGLNRRALETYNRVLDLYPALDSVRKARDKLSIEVDGRGI
jgi:tetratricopeptide (TPR) repeat protein